MLVAVGDFDDPRPLGELADQGQPERPVGSIEIGVPLVEQINRAGGISNNLAQDLQLPFAR